MIDNVFKLQKQDPCYIELLAIHFAVMNPMDVVINETDTFTLKRVKEFIKMSHKKGNEMTNEYGKDMERIMPMSNSEEELMRNMPIDVKPRLMEYTEHNELLSRATLMLNVLTFESRNKIVTIPQTRKDIQDVISLLVDAQRSLTIQEINHNAQPR